jgi:deoxyribodipyrimidine photo-lyase
MLWKKFLIANPSRLKIQGFDGTLVQWLIPTDRREISEIITVPHHPLWTMEFARSRLDRDFSSYDELRNLPAVDGSTRLSPYIRFGIFSIREIYAKFVPKPPLQRGAGGILIPGKNPQSTTEQVDSSFTKELTETLLNEIIWREFWYQIAYYFPFTYQIEFQERRRTIEWQNDTSSYEWQRFTE